MRFNGDVNKFLRGIGIKQVRLKREIGEGAMQMIFVLSEGSIVILC